MRLRVFDIGGSGVKTALFGVDDTDVLRIIGTIEHHKDPDWADFERWLEDRVKMDAQIIGISCAGFIDYSANVVKLFRVGNWINKPLKADVEGHFPNMRVYLLNDAEAHLTAHSDLFPRPQMCISIGTSLGFAIGDQQGNIIRPPDNMNFDLGQVAIPTRAGNNKVWWALGSRGLAELQRDLGNEHGTAHFGHRVGAFLASICSIFRPTTVVLGGGIIESGWESIQNNIESEFRQVKPDWLEQPKIVRSPYGKDAALWGMAKHVVNSARRK